MIDQKVSDAMRLAMRAHGAQQYGKHPHALPYVAHLGHVVAVLTRFGVTDADLLAAGWLHDTLEDTALTERELQEATNARITRTVRLVTNGVGKNRRERQTAMFDAFHNATSRERADAAIVKVSDRIANVEAAILSGSTLFKMYQSEHAVFRAHLRNDLPGGPMEYLSVILDVP